MSGIDNTDRLILNSILEKRTEENGKSENRIVKE